VCAAIEAKHLALEIATKTLSLNSQIQAYYATVWLPRFVDEVQRKNLSDSFPRPSLDYHPFNHVIQGFEPPFPIRRNKDVYTVDFLVEVIFPSLLDQFRSSFEVLEKEILDQVLQDATKHLRTEIWSACRHPLFFEMLVGNNEIVKERIRFWEFYGIEKAVVYSTIYLYVQKRVKTTSIFIYPPHPMDKTCSYSDETLNKTIFPSILDEISVSVEIIVSEIDIALRKLAMDNLIAKYRWNRYVLERIPSYQQFKDQSYDHKDNVMESIEKDISTGLFLQWLMIVYDDELQKWNAVFDYRRDCTLNSLFNYLCRLKSPDLVDREYLFQGLAYNNVLRGNLSSIIKSGSLLNLEPVGSEAVKDRVHREIVKEMEERYSLAFESLKKAFCEKYLVELE
jgi:hypothetical protein